MKPLILLRPHTHAGKAFSIGDRLDLPTPTAHWLIDHGIARADDTPARPATAQADTGTDVSPNKPTTTQRHIKDTKP